MAESHSPKKRDLYDPLLMIIGVGGLVLIHVVPLMAGITRNLGSIFDWSTLVWIILLFGLGHLRRDKSQDPPKKKPAHH